MPHNAIWNLSGTVDPTSVATPAPIGAQYSNTITGALYIKVSASDTGWALAAPGAVIFDDAVPPASNIRSNRGADQSPIDNTKTQITNLGSQDQLINPGATGATGKGSTIGGGDDNTASGDYSTVPGGSGGTASGERSVSFSGGVATGILCMSVCSGAAIVGPGAFAQGKGAFAFGQDAHAEGGTPADGTPFYGTNAGGKSAHAEGAGTDAGGDCSHAGGFGAVALHEAEYAHASGSLFVPGLTQSTPIHHVIEMWGGTPGVAANESAILKFGQDGLQRYASQSGKSATYCIEATAGGHLLNLTSYKSKGWTMYVNTRDDNTVGTTITGAWGGGTNGDPETAEWSLVLTFTSDGFFNKVFTLTFSTGSVAYKCVCAAIVRWIDANFS